jgi:hypothetical protein
MRGVYLVKIVQLFLHTDPRTDWKGKERILYDLSRIRHSCGRMIRLLPMQSLPPSPVHKLFLFLSLPVCCWSSLQTGEEGRGDKS